MRIRFVHIITLWLCTLPILLSAQEDTLVTWKADRLLVWNDFKGDPPERSQNDARSRLILSFTANSDKTPALIIETSAVFDPNVSWVHPSKKRLSLLKHEQGHFDICELHRRKFNKELLKLNRLTYENAEVIINRLFADIMKDYNAMHEQYDLETSHSRIRDKQAAWDLKIREDLAKLRPYAYSQTRIKLNRNP